MSGRLELPDFALETYFSRWEFTARWHLTASDAESMTIGELLALDEGESPDLDEVHLGYTPTWGTEPLREAIAGVYDGLSSDDTLGFAGAGEPLFWAMQLFVEPGDHVIVNVPNYQSIESVPVAAGVHVEGLPLWTDDGDGTRRWTLDLDRFESMLRPNTSLVSVNFPNNPTGFVPDADTWRAFVALCDERGVRLISDEVYRGVELDPANTIPAAAELSPRALSISVMSKAWGLPGLRVGWVASQDREALGRLERAKHYTSICNAGPSEVLATVALRNSEKILARNRAICTANDALVADFFGRRPELFAYESPVGGCVSFPRWLGPGTAAEFCTRAVEQDGVLLLPSFVYESGLVDVPMDHFRIGIGRTNVPECLDALARHLDATDLS